MNNYKLPDGWRLPDLLGAVEAERDRLREEIEVYQGLEALLDEKIDTLREENHQLRLALEFITRECDAPDKGPVAVSLAKVALEASRTRTP